MKLIARFIFTPKITALLVCVGFLVVAAGGALSWRSLTEASMTEFSDEVVLTFSRLGGDLVHCGYLSYESIPAPMIVCWKFPIRHPSAGTSVDGGQQMTFATGSGRCLVGLRIIRGKVSYFEIVCESGEGDTAQAALDQLRARYPGVRGTLRRTMLEVQQDVEADV